MRLRRKLAKLMVKVAPEIYSKYVSVDSKGELVLYVHLLNVLYGIMKVALLYYECFMLQILWMNLFLEVQDYKTLDTILYQDNQSTILLEKNGMQSSSKQTKHLNCYYYFITNRISAGDLSIEYCPTREMVSDFFMKPLQGELFLKFHHLIMNLPS